MTNVIQRGFAFGEDNGNEASHSLYGDNVNITGSVEDVKTLRIQLDAQDDPPGRYYSLRYQKNGSGGYVDVPVGSTRPNEILADTESFETDLGDWTNVSSASGWIRNSGSTTSSSTGPTYAYNGSYYIYIETSSGGSDLVGDTDTIEYDFGSSVSGYVLFAYNQYGSGQGTLNLDGYDGSTWTNIWTSTGDQGTSWHPIDSSETSFSSYTKIRFQNIATGDYRGDVALDYIRVYTLGTPLDNEIYIPESTNVVAGGEATTARLTPPSGKTTSDFTIGRRWDDENGDDSIDIASTGYTELEWIITTQSPTVDNDYYEFRVYYSGIFLYSYSYTPKLNLLSSVSFSVDSDSYIITAPETISDITNPVDSTSYSVAGNQVDLNAPNLVLPAEDENYILTGSDIYFNPMFGEPGSFTISSSNVFLDRSLKINFDDYVISTSDINFSLSLQTEAGTHTITGTDATLNVPIISEAGNFALTGTDVVFTKLQSSFYSLTGFPSNLLAEHDLDITLPSFDVSLSGTFVEPTEIFNLTFPPLEMEISAGNKLDISFPKFNFTSDGKFGSASTFNLTLPSWTFNAFVGSYIDLNLPRFTFDASATLNTPADIELSLSGLSFYSTGYLNPEIALDLTFPAITTTIETTSGNVGSLDNRLPRFSFSSIALSGLVGNIEGSFSSLKINIENKNTDPGSINMVIPVLDFNLALDETYYITTKVLRYAKDRIR